jgi:hypothetical protein
LADPDRETGGDRLRKGALWGRPPQYQDGRSSVARADLLESLRHLSLSDNQVVVAAIDAWNRRSHAPDRDELRLALGYFPRRPDLANKPPPRPDIPPRRKGAGRRSPAGARRTSRRVPQRGARQQAAVNNRRLLIFGVPAVLVVVLVSVIVIVSWSSSKTTSAFNWSTPTGIKVYGGVGPEGIPSEVSPALGAPNAGLSGATIDGVSCNSTEQLVYHHHVHLAVFIDGQAKSVPPGVGMVPPVTVTSTPHGMFAEGSQKCLYWLHVHAQDGSVHIESPQAANFFLGQVFGVWHQPLSADRLGRDTGRVTATVNGTAYTGDPTQIPLAEHIQIVLNLGSPLVKPPAVNWSGTGL